MKVMPGTRSTVLSFIFIVILFSSYEMKSQTAMGILPVSYKAVNTSLLSARQWQTVISGLHDEFVKLLSGTMTVSKLTREHILLLLKETPAADPENLDEQAYIIICKKEKLHYLLKYSVESVQVIDNNYVIQSKTIIIDGNNGKTFWEKPTKTTRAVNHAEINEQVMLDEVFIPIVTEISKEIKLLNY
jgi:hypothetical protein